MSVIAKTVVEGIVEVRLELECFQHKSNITGKHKTEPELVC
jgi:hypothetical protein